MKKKIPAGKGIAKAKKKKLSKKIKAAPITPKKTVSKKKETKQTVATKKISADKVKPGAKGKPVKAEEKRSGKTVGKISPKRKAPAKKAAVKKEKTLPAKVKKKAAPKKTDKIIKRKKALKKEKPEKAVSKSKATKSPISLKAAKERTSAGGSKRKVLTASKPRTKAKEESGDPISRLKKKTPIAKTRQEKLSGITGVVVGKKKEKRAITGKRGGGIKEIKEVKRTDKKIDAVIRPDYKMPDQEIKEDLSVHNPPVPSMPLPAEYGENGVSLLTVNPSRLFAFWEIKEDTLRIFQGYPKLRLYDVTSVDIGSLDASSYVDIEIDNRIGDRYISVSPGKDYFADIGILYSGGIFIGLARSLKVSTPHGMAAEEEVVPEQISDTGLRVGY